MCVGRDTNTQGLDIPTHFVRQQPPQTSQIESTKFEMFHTFQITHSPTLYVIRDPLRVPHWTKLPLFTSVSGSKNFEREAEPNTRFYHLQSRLDWLVDKSVGKFQWNISIWYLTLSWMNAAMINCAVIGLGRLGCRIVGKIEDLLPLSL